MCVATTWLCGDSRRTGLTAHPSVVLAAAGAPVTRTPCVPRGRPRAPNRRASGADGTYRRTAATARGAILGGERRQVWHKLFKNSDPEYVIVVLQRMVRMKHYREEGL